MTLPPYAGMLGLSEEAAAAVDGPGAPVLVMPFGDDVLGRPGFLHGGAIAGLLEMAAIAAVRHALDANGSDGGSGSDAVRIEPVTLTIDFMRGGRDKPTRAAGVVTRLGTRVANVEATAWQDDRAKPIAAARMNYLLARG